MAKYIVESIGMFRQIHVVEAENEDTAMEIARTADDNWQQYLGEMKVDISEFTPERIKHFQEKEFFWEGISFKDENGVVRYKHKNGQVV
tara:strand:+ start:31 stop:297 length:267 start_codon:yes stop_codon:yes gene_type:complete